MFRKKKVSNAENGENIILTEKNIGVKFDQSWEIMEIR